MEKLGAKAVGSPMGVGNLPWLEAGAKALAFLQGGGCFLDEVGCSR